MSWIRDDGAITWFQQMFIDIVKSGNVPKHLAIIMDGNRRYAKSQHWDNKTGYINGFYKLSKLIAWCTNVGIREITVYAFSIENFKRPKDDVDTIMDIFREKMEELYADIDYANGKGMCFRIIGNIDYIEPDLRHLFSKIQTSSKDSKALTINIAIAYTSRDEITHAVKTVVKGVENKIVQVDDIDEELLTKCMYMNKSISEPDLLIRTSGEVRFSDFLLWQTSYTYVLFIKVMWPLISIWYLLWAIFLYQRAYHVILKNKPIKDVTRIEDVNKNKRRQKLIDQENSTQLEKLVK